MQLVPLSTDGRVTIVVTPVLPLGPVRVALRLDAGNVVIDTLGPGGARRVGRFGAADAAAYRPVLARLAARGQIGTCPARVVDTGALILHLGSPTTCAPREVIPRSRAPLAGARTARLRAAVPTVCAVRPSTVPQQRPAPPASRSVDDGRRPMQALPVRQSLLPARPPVRFGQPDDAAPRLTGDQRRRVLAATVAIAAALVLACTLQPGAPGDAAADVAGACTDGTSSCR